MINFAEYGIVCFLLAFSGLAFIVQIHDLNILGKKPKLRITVKSFAYTATVLLVVVSLIVVKRLKGDKPWSNIKWDDISWMRLNIVDYLTTVSPWVVGAFVVGVATGMAVAYFLVRRKRLLCPNRQLHKIAESDREQMQDRVRVYGVSCHTHFTDNVIPHIDFVISLYNLALVEVSISDSLAGYIEFWKDGVHGREHKMRRVPTIEENRATNCLFRGSPYFTVRQDVEPEEVASISSGSGESFFRLSALKVTMRGQAFSEVMLNLDLRVKKDSVCWADKPEYIFGGDERRDSVLRELNKFLLEGQSLLYRAVEGKTSYLTEAVAEWEQRAGDYMSTHIDRNQKTQFLDNVLETYIPLDHEVVKSKPRFVNKIHTRVVRLERLIEKLRLGSPIVIGARA